MHIVSPKISALDIIDSKKDLSIQLQLLVGLNHDVMNVSHVLS